MPDRLPQRLRHRAADERQSRPRCYCGRPVPQSSACSCCCGEHNAPRTDGGPSLREYLASKGEL